MIRQVFTLLARERTAQRSVIRRLTGMMVVLAACSGAREMPAQACAAIAPDRSDVAIGQALEVSSLSANLGALAPRHLRVLSRVLASPFPVLEVVVAGADNLGHIVVTGLANRDSMCFAGIQGPDGGVFVTFRWNAAIVRVAPSLDLSSPTAVRRLVAAALTFASGQTVDSVTTASSTVAIAPGSSGLVGKATVNLVGAAYNVAGALESRTDRRLFFYRVDHKGRLVTVYIQTPADPLSAP